MIYDSLLTYLLQNKGVETTSKPPERVMEKAATEFEALFLYEILKQIPLRDGMMGKGLGGEVYEGLFKMELSRELARRGTGLKEMILRNLKQLEQPSADNKTTSGEL
ncbi:MAG: hypothetical protein D6710_00860 [Nitrospirae bacterium]|nr:MAG: hypothetical protein D6710_00860 [Nitrospirota bacterium]